MVYDPLHQQQEPVFDSQSNDAFLSGMGQYASPGPISITPRYPASPVPSYPHGDYSDRDIELCRQAGYDCGITVDFGFNTVTTDRFRLKRLSVNDTDDLNELIVKASGLWQFVKTLLREDGEFGWTDDVEP